MTFQDMQVFRRRHHTGPTSQNNLLNGRVFQCELNGLHLAGQLANCGVSGDVSADAFELHDLKRKRTCLHIPRQALSLEGQFDAAGTVPQVQCDIQIGDARIDTDDVRTCACGLATN